MVSSGRKKPPASLVIRMTGSGVRPWAVPTGKLATTLRAVQRLLRETDYDDAGTDLDGLIEGIDDIDGPLSLFLLGVRSSSAAYQVGARDPERTINVLRLTGRAIDNPEGADWTPNLLNPVKELSEVASSLGCEIEFRLPTVGKHMGDVIATIGPKTYEIVSDSAFAYGPTAVYGTIERVGGASRMHCGIRVADQPSRMIICKVASEDLVRALGKHIYQEAFISGNATWYRRDWKIRTMTITGLEEPKKGSILKALHKIHAAGGSVWDNIDDPTTKLAEMRG